MGTTSEGAGGRIVLTGAGGFVGQHLLRRLLADGKIGENGAPITSLVLVDVALNHVPDDPRVRAVVGDLGDSAILASALADGVDVLYHLASIPGGLTERNYELGRKVNIDSVFALLEAVRDQNAPPRVVFTSTVAVYGAPMPDLIDDLSPLQPTLTYGVQKLMMEGVVSDFTRKGWIDGRSVRLPGIVARPRVASGLMSAFLSDIFTVLRDGEKFVCPVSPQGTEWFLSVPACVECLIHAAAIAPAILPAWRVWNLPAQRLSIGSIVDGVAEVVGKHVYDLISYDPNPALERQFCSKPPFSTAIADRLGFKHDGTPAGLVRNALAAADQG
jgi:nucleoside-diphosphate-sugar epimerase